MIGRKADRDFPLQGIASVCSQLEDKVNDAVAEVIGKLVNNPKFENEIRTKIGNSLDTKDLEKDHTNLKEQLKQLQGAKNKLASQMDHLSVSDKHYDKKYQDMQERMDGLYDERKTANQAGIIEIKIIEDNEHINGLETKLVFHFTRVKSFEVFFKVCKSYLCLSKECNSLSYDAMTAHTAVVFTRYMILSLEN